MLGDDRLHVSGELRLVQPDRQPRPRSAQVVGVDLHVLVGDGWLRLAFEDVACAASERKRPVRQYQWRPACRCGSPCGTGDLGALALVVRYRGCGQRSRWRSGVAWLGAR